jgi:aminodeoxyfutalosine synthase
VRVILDRQWWDVLEKVENGVRLGREDGIRLMRTPDVLAVGYLADRARAVRAGSAVYFVNGGYINYSNVCAISCRFCAFGKSVRHPDAYTMSADDVVARAVGYARQGARELHMVGGLHPDLPLEYYLDVVRRIRAAAPSMHIKAFTAVEVDHFARLAHLSVEEVLEQLRRAGLDSLPGGGAEIFAPRARRLICRPKIDGERWLEIHRIAHRLGIPTNATMLYGHVETPEERVDHLLALRELQDETGGFQCFVPLGFHPAGTGLAHLPGPTGWDDLRVIAVSRLLLDNFRAIKAYWVSLTPALARVALRFGANDLDGTVREERIYHDAGSVSPPSLTRDEICAMIREAGLEPCERDGLYRAVAA